MSRLSEQVQNAVPLWDEHLRTPFPAGLRGVEFGGTDLVLLDAEIAGCVLTWLNNGGTLDPERTRVLRSRIEDLDRVLPQIPGSAGVRYCQRLRRLALLVSAALSGVG
ncbi:hypothetical protein [Streptomyces lydicus]|uniref:hypothetical protein n=1 Tax=Streptomyces lydicus TaxID=47763 RepID=UPI001F505B20|nr:hypothetical protein [Streptomyces lydicus]MCZ1007901.1 hypothetical protein [Streptomyces lydicus]